MQKNKMSTHKSINLTETQASFDSCKKIIFNVEFIVKDTQGNCIVKAPIDDIGKVLSPEGPHHEKIVHVIDELENKIQHIFKTRGIIIENNKEDRHRVKVNKTQADENANHDLGLLRLFQQM
jgi:hypothetical protein